jgi:hypothetical protein
MDATLEVLVSLLAYCNTENTYTTTSVAKGDNGFEEEKTDSTSDSQTNQHTEILYDTTKIKDLITSRIQLIGQTAKHVPLFGQHYAQLVSAVTDSSHFELVALMRTSLRSVASGGLSGRSWLSVEDNLSGLVRAVGLEHVVDIIAEVAERSVDKVLAVIDTLRHELSSCAMKHKLVVFNVFLSVAAYAHSSLSDSLKPLYDLVLLAGNSALCIPYFKMLTVVASGASKDSNVDLVLTCISLVANFSKTVTSRADSASNGPSKANKSSPAKAQLSLQHHLEAHIKSAVLSSVDTMKDFLPYCNVFQRDTLRTFERFSECNYR